MSFRLRTALTIAILTALALGGAFTAVSGAFNGLQRRQLDASLRSVAEDEAAEAPSHGFAFTDRPGPAANDVGPLTKYGVIYGEDDRVLAATPPFDVAPPPLRSIRHPSGEAFDLWFKGSHLRGVLVPIRRNTRKTLFLATSRDDLDGDEAFLFRAMLVAFLVAVAWAAAVAYWMGGRLTRAHNAIASVARTVTRGDLSARVEVKSRDPEVAQLGRDINEMVVRLGELLHSQQRFIAHAAHELRSPLAALYGELQQAIRKERGADGYRAAIETALASTRRLTVLAEDLLTLARTRGTGAADTTPVRVHAAIAEARGVSAALARERGVEIVIDLDEACWVPDRNGDTARLFRNLIENAIRHSPRNGVVRVESSATGATVRIAISDDGAGVPEAERLAIFEPFFRSACTSRTEGAGLGLGIAREIARAHGGDVVLDDALSAKTRGARFVVSLPATEPPHERPGAPAT